MKILCMNKISAIGTDRFGQDYECGTDTPHADGILVRSASLLDMRFDPNLKAIARAGAGVNNIPLERCSEEGIVVFNTPGANANAVKELVLAALFMTSRKILPGADWVKSLKGTGDIAKQIEKGKSNFVGPEIKGKQLGVIGLGAIGILVANAAKALGMTVFGYDPYISVDSAWHLSHSVNRANSLEELYANSDYISLHLPLIPQTKGMIDAEAIGKMKPGIRILNFARGDLVNSADVIKGLVDNQIAGYATDFPDDALIGAPNVVAIPHLGASTPESEDNCAVMAVDQMKEFLENGNILNSVNMPDISMAHERGTRICILHRNQPNMIGHISTACGNANINIENMLSKSRNGYAYTIVDVSGEVTEQALQKINELKEIVRIRVIPPR